MVSGRSFIGVGLILTAVAAAAPAQAQTTVGPAYVTRVVDADTLYVELGGRLEVVRYLGINTPRIEHPLFGPRPYALLAREANRRLVEGKWVYLVFDGSVRNHDDRLLAYVWVNDVLVNALLVHRGYAETAAASTAGYVGYFASLEDGARRDARGLWRDPATSLYHRPRATEQAADEQDQTSGVTSGGRVFSAPAPFVPAMPSAQSFAPSVGPPARAPQPTAPSPSYGTSQGPRRNMR